MPPNLIFGNSTYVLYYGIAEHLDTENLLRPSEIPVIGEECFNGGNNNEKNHIRCIYS